MFPDSKISQKYGCARTKTSALVQYTASETKKEISELLQKTPFSLATDGSTDSNAVKLYPIVVSFFNAQIGQISTLLLSLLESTDNTGEGIFSVINSELSSLAIPWENCISFSSDNAYTMIGANKGVAKFVKDRHSSVYVSGCSCHLIHICAQKAAAQLPVNVENFLVQLYYYLDKSSKRQNTLKVYQAICGTEGHKILKCVSTRWLSLLQSINRVLEQWEALTLMFCSDPHHKNESTKQFETVKSFLQDPHTKLFCYFLQSTLPVFNSVNLFLQQDAPAIHLLRRNLNGLLTDLLVRFVQPCSIQSESTSLSSVEFKKRKYQKGNEDLVIGAKARAYLKENDCDEQMFYNSVREFYMAACSYIIRKFPLDDEFLQHAEVVDISLRMKVSYSSLEYFVRRFPSLVKESEHDKLEEEFAVYQYDTFPEYIVHGPKIDVNWGNIAELKNESGQMKYKTLSNVVFAVLSVPHSNSPTERVFSVVRKNQTEFRPTLSTSTLESLLVQKTKMSSQGEVCFKKTYTEKQLLGAKQATKNFLSQN